LFIIEHPVRHLVFMANSFGSYICYLLPFRLSMAIIVNQLWAKPTSSGCNTCCSSYFLLYTRCSFLGLQHVVVTSVIALDIALILQHFHANAKEISKKKKKKNARAKRKINVNRVLGTYSRLRWARIGLVYVFRMALPNAWLPGLPFYIHISPCQRFVLAVSVRFSSPAFDICGELKSTQASRSCVSISSHTNRRPPASNFPLGR